MKIINARRVKLLDDRMLDLDSISLLPNVSKSGDKFLVTAFIYSMSVVLESHATEAAAQKAHFDLHQALVARI